MKKYPSRILMVDTYQILNNNTVKSETMDWLDLPYPHVFPKAVNTKIHQTDRKRQKQIAEKFNKILE